MSTEASDEPLTICSVAFFSAEHLRLNWNATRTLNSHSDRIRWIVAENTPENAESSQTLWGDERFEVVSGVSSEHPPTYQHTIALNKILMRSRTRFVLILDPDFYIIRKEWLTTLVDYVVSRRLSFIGVPWNPRHTSKYRNFPAVHCFFVDTARLPIEEIDFRPDDMAENNDGTLRTVNPCRSSRIKRFNPLWSLVTRVPIFRARHRIHTDTGGRMFRRFVGQEEHQYQCMMPVYRPDLDSPSLSWKGRLLEHFLPDELCYLPRKNTYRNTGFRELGLWTDAPEDWEEFFWLDEPFGFHVRRNLHKGDRDATTELESLRDQLRQLIGEL